MPEPVSQPQGDYRPTLLDLQALFNVAGYALEAAPRLPAESPVREALVVFGETAGRLSDQLTAELGPGSAVRIDGEGLTTIAQEIRDGHWDCDRREAV